MRIGDKFQDGGPSLLRGIKARVPSAGDHHLGSRSALEGAETVSSHPPHRRCL